jgi:hypothetical protein
VRIVFLVLLVAATAAGCTVNDKPQERRVALRALVQSIGVEPRSDDAAVRIGRTQSKSDYPYFSANGVLAVSRAVGIARAEAALEGLGWEVFESGDVGYFLGSCVRARKESMVAIVSVGWNDSPTNNVYPRLPGRVYVHASVGREGSNQVWTDPERPTCGA